MNRLDLLKSIKAVTPGVSKKAIVESMLYLYFSGTHVVSYNDTITIQFPLVTDFVAFVKADDLKKVIEKLTSPEIAFKLEGNLLKMKSGKVLTSFATITDDAITEMMKTVQDTFDKKKAKVLPDNFLELVSMCSHVTSTNENTQTLTCIYISGKVMIATDNVRIAVAELTSDMDEMLLKASEIRALVAINPTSYMATKAWIHFVGEDNCVFSIRRVKGEYPDMVKFTEFDGTTVDLPKELINGADIASVFTDEVDSSINITIKTGMCRVYKESGAGKIDFREPIKYDGPTISFNISPELLKEMMGYSTSVVLTDNRARISSKDMVLVTSLYRG